MGPYHHARVNSLCEKFQTTAIDIRAGDSENAPRTAEQTLRFRRMIAGGGDSYSSAAVYKALDVCRPAGVAIPGWSAPPALHALQWCVDRNVPAVLMSETQSWDAERAWRNDLVKRWIVSFFSAALVGGKSHRDYLCMLGMPEERIFLGYDAVDNEHFVAGAAKARAQETALRSRYGLPKKYFLAAARFIPKKNLQRLIRAFALYRTKAKDSAGDRLRTEGNEFPWSLVILGDGPLKADINRQIADLALQRFVIQPGLIDYSELPNYYALASAFIHASTTEQWGLVVNEAMASGLPLLLSKRCGSAEELLVEGVNGLSFDPFNVEEMANLMLYLSTHEDKAARMGAEARQKINQYGLGNFASGFERAMELAVRRPVRQTGFIPKAALRMSRHPLRKWVHTHRESGGPDLL